MKNILVALGLLALVGCSNSYETLDYPVLPEGLKDCKFYRVNNDNGGSMKVVRCPNSSTTTTYSEGKSEASAAVVEEPAPY